MMFNHALNRTGISLLSSRLGAFCTHSAQPVQWPARSDIDLPENVLLKLMLHHRLTQRVVSRQSCMSPPEAHALSR